MNENVKAWIEALRSGEYRQSTDALRKKDGYCCLGVACEVYREATGMGKWNLERGNEYIFRISDGDSDDLSLPPAVQKWLGLCSPWGGFVGFDGGSLATRNDTGASFEEIAELIESEPKGLFAQ